MNLPALCWSSRSTALLIYGVRESARVEHVHGRLQGRGARSSSSCSASPPSTADNLSPFSTDGFNGDRRRRGADLLRLHRLRRGLDRSARRSKEPERDMPSAIIGSLADRDRALHRSSALVATGGAALRTSSGREPAPLAFALDEGAGHRWGADLIDARRAGRDHERRADDLYGQTRIMFAMCRDGLLPARLRQALSDAQDADAASPLPFGILTGVPDRLRAARRASPSWSTSAPSSPSSSSTSA